jgi:hypothetical protein
MRSDSSSSTNDTQYQVGAMEGVAFNFGAAEEAGVSSNEAQSYAQLIVNAGLRDRFAVSIVPTVFRNPRIEDVDAEGELARGVDGQYYGSDSASLLAEWVVSTKSVAYPNDALTFSLQLKTRGHFFKVLFTNQVRMNPTQFLVGTPFG